MLYAKNIYTSVYIQKGIRKQELAHQSGGGNLLFLFMQRGSTIIQSAPALNKGPAVTPTKWENKDPSGYVPNNPLWCYMSYSKIVK